MTGTRAICSSQYSKQGSAAQPRPNSRKGLMRLVSNTEAAKTLRATAAFVHLLSQRTTRDACLSAVTQNTGARVSLTCRRPNRVTTCRAALCAPIAVCHSDDLGRKNSGTHGPSPLSQTYRCGHRMCVVTIPLATPHRPAHVPPHSCINSSIRFGIMTWHR